MFLDLATSIDKFVGSWSSNGEGSGLESISCSKVSVSTLNCTRTPRNDGEPIEVLLVSWDGDSSFTVKDKGKIMNGTYDNDKAIEWINHDGKRTTWTKEGKYLLLHQYGVVW